MGLHLQDRRVRLGEDQQDQAWSCLGLRVLYPCEPELCLLATCGSPKRIDAGVHQVIMSPRQEHSRKPAEAYERIEKLLAGRKLELFARNRRPGWTSIGNQLLSQDNEAMPHSIRISA